MADFGAPPVPGTEPAPFLAEAATPDAFGAAPAAASEQMGATEQGGLLDAHRILASNQYDADLSAAQVRAAQLRPQMQAATAAIQGDPALQNDVKQYAPRVAQAFDDIAGQVTDDISNPKIARIMSAQVADMKASYTTDAQQWQTAQVGGLAAGGASALLNSINQTAADPKTQLKDVLSLQQHYADYLHQLQGITPDMRSSMGRSGLEQIALTYGYAKAYSANPDDVRDAFQFYQSGGFEKLGVRGDQLHLLGRMLDSRIAHVDAQKTAANAAQVAGFTVQAEQTLSTVGAGGNVPMPDLVAQAQQARAWAEASQASGKPKPELFSLANRLDAAVEKVNVNGIYGPAKPADTLAAAQAAEAEIARKKSAGAPVSLQEATQASALRDIANQQINAVQTDPWSLAPQRGVAPVRLDPTNPASYHQRAMQAQQLQQVLGTGYPIGPLQRSEAEELGRQAASSDAGRTQALASLDNFDTATRDIAARQVSPHDSTFVIEAGLDPYNRQVVQQGRERILADQAFWNAKPADALPGDKPPAREHIAALNARVDAALGQSVSQTDIAGIKATATNWIAGMLVRQGKSSGMAITDNDVQNGLRAALGGHVASNGTVTGGIGSWSSPDKLYLIPPSVNATGFAHLVQRQSAADRAIGRGPVNPDGTPFDLAQATPVFVGNGTYQWRTPTGMVMTAARPKHTPELYQTRVGQ